MGSIWGCLQKASQQEYRPNYHSEGATNYGISNVFMPEMGQKVNSVNFSVYPIRAYRSTNTLTLHWCIHIDSAIEIMNSFYRTWITAVLSADSYEPVVKWRIHNSIIQCTSDQQVDIKAPPTLPVKLFE